MFAFDKFLMLALYDRDMHADLWRSNANQVQQGGRQQGEDRQ
jgi:hypothetical protein